MACYQSYLIRWVPSAFNEAFYLGLSVLILVEGMLLGVPAWLISSRSGETNPTVEFIIETSIRATFCLAILGPMVASKLDESPQIVRRLVFRLSGCNAQPFCIIVYVLSFALPAINPRIALLGLCVVIGDTLGTDEGIGLAEGADGGSALGALDTLGDELRDIRLAR